MRFFWSFVSFEEICIIEVTLMSYDLEDLLAQLPGYKSSIFVSIIRPFLTSVVEWRSIWISVMLRARLYDV